MGLTSWRLLETETCGCGKESSSKDHLASLRRAHSHHGSSRHHIGGSFWGRRWSDYRQDYFEGLGELMRGKREKQLQEKKSLILLSSGMSVDHLRENDVTSIINFTPSLLFQFSLKWRPDASSILHYSLCYPNWDTYGSACEALTEEARYRQIQGDPIEWLWLTIWAVCLSWEEPTLCACNVGWRLNELHKQIVCRTHDEL